MPLKALLGISYQDSNKAHSDSAPIVLLHGAGSSHLGWPAVFRYMPDRRVLSIDLPGHGASDAEQPSSIEEYAEQLFVFLDHLQIDQVIIAGFSMGAVIAREMLLTQQKHFSKAIFLSYPLNFTPGILLDDYAMGMATQAHLIETFSNSLVNAAGNTTQQNLLTAPIHDGEQLFHDLTAIQSYRTSFHQSTVHNPTLWVFGEKDAFSENKHRQIICEQFSNAQIEEIPNAGHLAVWEYPDRVLQITTDFLLA